MKMSRRDDTGGWHGVVNALCITRPRDHATSPIVHNSHSESFLDHQLDSDVHSHVSRGFEQFRFFNCSSLTSARQH